MNEHLTPKIEKRRSLFFIVALIYGDKGTFVNWAGKA